MTETALAEEPARPLREALRRARLEAAERSQAIADLRAVAYARLDLLREALAPVFREVPTPNDLFDPALVPGDPPRLFIDLVAFVDLARDQRTYRFVRDTQTGRQVLLENTDIARLVETVTDYMARRIVEREQAMASLGNPVFAERQPSPAAGWRMALILGILLGILIGAGAISLALR